MSGMSKLTELLEDDFSTAQAIASEAGFQSMADMADWIGITGACLRNWRKSPKNRRKWKCLILGAAELKRLRVAAEVGV